MPTAQIIPFPVRPRQNQPQDRIQRLRSILARAGGTPAERLRADREALVDMFGAAVQPVDLAARLAAVEQQLADLLTKERGNA